MKNCTSIDKKNILRNLFCFCFTHIKWIVWIIKFWLSKRKKKSYRFEKHQSVRVTLYTFWLVSSSWTQIYPSRLKEMLSSPCKVVIKICPLPQTSQIEAKTSVACMFLVMDMTFLILCRPGMRHQATAVIFLGSAFGTCAVLRMLSNISKIHHFSSLSSLWCISIFSRVDQSNVPLPMQKQK